MTKPILQSVYHGCGSRPFPKQAAWFPHVSTCFGIRWNHLSGPESWGIWYSTLPICVSSPTLWRLLAFISVRWAVSPGAVSISVGQNDEPPETDGLMMFNSNILFLCINWPSHFGRHNMASSRLWFHCHSGSFIHCFSADCCRQPYSGCSDSLGHFRNSWYKMLRKRVSSEVFLSMLSEFLKWYQWYQYFWALVGGQLTGMRLRKYQWLGTFFIFQNIWDNPFHWLIFFRGVGIPPTSICSREQLVFQGMVRWCEHNWFGAVDEKMTQNQDMVQSFLGAFFLTFVAFIFVSFNRLWQAMSSWLQERQKWQNDCFLCWAWDWIQKWIPYSGPNLLSDFLSNAKSDHEIGELEVS